MSPGCSSAGGLVVLWGTLQSWDGGFVVHFSKVFGLVEFVEVVGTELNP